MRIEKATLENVYLYDPYLLVLSKTAHTPIGGDSPKGVYRRLDPPVAATVLL